MQTYLLNDALISLFFRKPIEMLPFERKFGKMVSTNEIVMNFSNKLSLCMQIYFQ